MNDIEKRVLENKMNKLEKQFGMLIYGTEKELGILFIPLWRRLTQMNSEPLA